jgi:hypothetical protein
MNPHPLAPSPNLPRLFLPAYWLSGEGPGWGAESQPPLSGRDAGLEPQGPDIGSGAVGRKPVGSYLVESIAP